MEKYLDWRRNLGEIKLVVFYAWDSYLTRTFRKDNYETKPATPVRPWSGGRSSSRASR